MTEEPPLNRGYEHYPGNPEIRTRDLIILGAIVFSMLGCAKHYVDKWDRESEERWREAHAPVYREYTPDPRSIPTCPEGR